MNINIIKCHVCGRNARLIHDYYDDMCLGNIYEFQCGKGHISKLMEKDRIGYDKVTR